ncbi:MAG: hypothetical protein QNJ16_09235 [Rhodobacter sp.]|nr:hypothetical protein [Rhodobacter sp.]
MSGQLTDEEAAELPEKCEEVDRYDFVDDTDADNYVNLVLYKAPDGQLFRFVEASGMNSEHDGAAGFGEWVDNRTNWHGYD